MKLSVKKTWVAPPNTEPGAYPNASVMAAGKKSTGVPPCISKVVFTSVIRTETEPDPVGERAERLLPKISEVPTKTASWFLLTREPVSLNLMAAGWYILMRWQSMRPLCHKRALLIG